LDIIRLQLLNEIGQEILPVGWACSFGSVDPCSVDEFNAIAATPNGFVGATTLRVLKDNWASTTGAHSIDEIDAIFIQLRNIAGQNLFETEVNSSGITLVKNNGYLDIPLGEVLNVHEIYGKLGLNSCGCNEWRFYDNQYKIDLYGKSKLYGDVHLQDTIEINGPGEYALFNNNVFPTLYSVDRVSIRHVNNDKTPKNGTLSLMANVYHVSINIVDIVTSLGGSLSENPLIWQFAGSECQKYLDPIGGAGYELPDSVRSYFLNFYLNVVGFDDSGLVCCDTYDPNIVEAEKTPPDKPQIDCDCEALFDYIQFLQDAILILNNRLEKVEIQMTEIADGMDCICNAIQNLSLECNPTVNNEIDNTGLEAKLESIKNSIDSLTLECNPSIENQVYPSPVPVTVQPSPVPVTVEPSPVPITVEPSGANIQNNIDFSTVNNNLLQIKTAIDNIQMNISTGDVTLNQDYQQLINALNDLFKCDTENLACVLRNRLEMVKGEETKSITEIINEKIIPETVNEIHTNSAQTEVFQTVLNDYNNY
jgi:hypothetical protein